MLKIEVNCGKISIQADGSGPRLVAEATYAIVTLANKMAEKGEFEAQEIVSMITCAAKCVQEPDCRADAKG